MPDIWEDYNSGTEFNTYDDVTLWESDDGGTTVSAGGDNGSVGVTVTVTF